MYVQGVSTRKVAKITEELCGFEVTSTQVSRAAKELDEILDQWRKRPLGSYPYVYLDARYEKVRHSGSVVDVAVLVAIGVSDTGHRHILGTAPRLTSWAETNIPEGLTVFEFPSEHRKRIRTSNVLERVNKEIRRRTRVASIFPNEESCLRLVSAVLMEISEDWETSRIYLKI